MSSTERIRSGDVGSHRLVIVGVVILSKYLTTGENHFGAWSRGVGKSVRKGSSARSPREEFSLELGALQIELT